MFTNQYFSPNNCIWNDFDGECFDEEPIPEGGFPDPNAEPETTEPPVTEPPVTEPPATPTPCTTCGLEAEKIADEPENTDTHEEEETDNPKFMRPVKVVSNDQVRLIVIRINF